MDIRSLLIKCKLRATASSPELISISCFSKMLFKWSWICSMVWVVLKYWLILVNSSMVKLFSKILELLSVQTKLILFPVKLVEIVYNILFWYD